jgi:outer membrane protein OmpA-like peptidoglycan-associated protein
MRALFALAMLATCGLAAASEVPVRVPFVKGLTTVRIATSSVGDYETLRTVTGVSGEGYSILTSGEAPADSGEGLIPVSVERKVRATDQLHSRNVRIAWHSSDREGMTGNTPGISCDVFGDLHSRGKAEITYLDVSALAGIAVTRRKLKGTISVVDRKPFTVMVNRKRLALPALHVAGVLSDEEDSEPFDFHVLDDPDNPMMLRAKFTETEAHVVSVEFPAAADSLERSLATQEVVELSGIWFSFASATLREQSDIALNQLATVLKDHADWKFRIDGHTDSIGSDSSNLALSQRRSAAVRAALVDRLGVPAARLSTAGFGESRPKESNDSEAGRARNRRVELVRLTPAATAAAHAPTPGAPVLSGSACRFSKS